MAKLSRWERKIARDAQLKYQPRQISHFHRCTCTKTWFCKESQPACGATEQDCVQCKEKKRAIEAERNSGEQMHIEFEPVFNYYTNTGYLIHPFALADIINDADIKNAINILKGQSIKPASGQSIDWYPGHVPVKYNIQYSVHKVDKLGKVVPETDKTPDSGKIIDAVVIEYKEYPTKWYLHGYAENGIPICDIVPPNPIKNEEDKNKKYGKYILPENSII